MSQPGLSGGGSLDVPGLLGGVCWKFPQGALPALGRTSAVLWHRGVREGWKGGGTGSKTEFNLQSLGTRVIINDNGIS